jgi:predicted amino acid racemase
VFGSLHVSELYEGVLENFLKYIYNISGLKYISILTLNNNFCILCIVSLRGRQHGSLAQLGEHLPYKQGVIGSSPIVPTNKAEIRGLLTSGIC